MLESLIPQLMKIKGWNATILQQKTGCSWKIAVDTQNGVVPKSAMTLDRFCSAFKCQPNDLIMWKEKE